MILPVRRETLIIPQEKETVMARLGENINSGRRSEQGEKLFTGSLKEGKLQISLQINRPENFIPQINGHFEESTTGCILFLKYTLIFSSRMFVVFWSITAFLFAFFLWFMSSNFWLGLAAACALALNIIVTQANFQRQYKRSREALHGVLFNSG